MTEDAPKIKKKYNYTKKTGRPSKKDKLNYKKIEELLGCGLTEKQLASFLDVSWDSIQHWKRTDKKFLNILKTAKAKFDQTVVKSLKDRALGYRTTYKKNFVVSDGKDCGSHIESAIEEIIYPPDATSCIFWLKNRDRDNWRDKIDYEHGLNDDLLEKYKDMKTDELIRASKDIARALLATSGNTERNLQTQVP